MALIPKPQIDQIKIKDKTYDINVPKSWAENDPNKVEYIKDRTHSRELLEGKDLPNAVAKYSFKNIYVDGNQIYSDNWKPQASWIYAAWECEHGDNAQAHLLDLSCSGGWYEFEFYALDINGNQTLLAGPVNAWINPRNSASDESNEIQIIADLSELAGTTLESWQHCKIYYNTAGFFYISGEPTVSAKKGNASSARNALYVKPVTTEPEYTQVTDEGTTLNRYRRYLSVTRLDASYLPIDGKTVLLDNNGNLTAEDIYVSDFQVTEQFGRYEPLEWVPAEGRSVKDVLNDAFCTDQLPTAVDPTVELFTDTATNYYEVGSTVDLDWAVRLNKGSYTYGLVDSNKEIIADTGEGSGKAYSNYYATAFTTAITQQPDSADNIQFIQEGERVNECTIRDNNNFEDSCLTPNDVGANFKTLKNGTEQLVLPKDPITEFTLTLIVNGMLEKSYSAATMLGDIPKNLVEFKNYETLTYTTSNLLTSDYRWFWAVSDENAPEPLSISSATIRAFNSKLGGFDSFITTNKMKSMCFFLPKARAKYNKESGDLETSVEVLNDATGASACLNMLCTEVKVNDAGNNEHDYLMYYFTNDAPDSGTNTYEVIVNDLLEGGNS